MERAFLFYLNFKCLKKMILTENEELIIRIESGNPNELKERVVTALIASVRWYAASEHLHLQDRDNLTVITELLHAVSVECKVVAVA